MTDSIHYSIKPSNPNAHLYSVSLVIEKPQEQGQILRMPAWIPGSYMVREFAKNVVDITAISQGQEIVISKRDKSSWQLAECQGPVEIRYSVYAWDESVRSAHLDQTHAYFNGTSVFLEVLGQSDLPCTVDILNADIPEAKNWRVATTLKEQGIERYDFGRYSADSYDDLIDHPVEIADFTLGTFEACGVPHELVITGKHYADVERICNDLKKICEHHIRFFGEPAPMDRYLFLTWVVGNGYGGLEHRSSTSLICKRSDLPNQNTGPDISDDYQNFLGLCSHEYFHTWNVKRIKPAVFIPYDLNQEVHTTLLWAFEGITSYYDDLGVYRAGLITPEKYLAFLAKIFTRVFRADGRKIQSISESSFDTWTKFYKQDENAINAISSYYTKGALAILAIDLKLRSLSNHQVSFNDVIKQLWQDYVEQTRDGDLPKGVAEGDIENIVLSLVDENSKAELSDLMEQVLRGVDDYDYNHLFEFVGVTLKKRGRTNWADTGGKATESASGEGKKPYKPWLGMMVQPDSLGAKVFNVAIGSAASEAGISAGDIIVAIDNLKASKDSIEQLFAPFKPGQTVSVHAFRNDVMMQFDIEMPAEEADTYYFEIIDETKLEAWLKA